MNRKSLLLFPIFLFLVLGAMGCGTWFQNDNSEENFWEDEVKGQGKGVSSSEAGDMKTKMEEMAKEINDSEAKISILEGEVGDVSSRVQKEKDSLQGIKKSLGKFQSGGGGSAEDANELRRQIKILENDVEWLKWIKKNY